MNSIIIPDTSRMILNKLNRARLFSQTFTRTLDAVGNYQLVLPDYPVTGITSIQLGSALVPFFPLPAPGAAPTLPILTYAGYSGYRFVPWAGDLPGNPTVIEMISGVFWYGAQNVKVIYQAGYLISNESQTIPSTSPYTITTLQPQGIWCKDGGVTFATGGTALTAVTGTPTTGQYIPPADPPGTLAALGQYTFSLADAGKTVLLNYSFVPFDLEMACIQMVGEMFSYRDRIGQLDKTLGGQETIRFLRGGIGRGQMFDMPPEVEARIWPYISVIPPAIGAPV